MNAVFAIFLLPFLIFTQSQFDDNQNWRQIVPLKSSRTDVEGLLGPTQQAFFATYQLKEGNLFIEYSSGPCTEERKGGWNVPKDVVISVSFSPKRKRRIAAIKLASKKFRKVIDQHVVGITYYINDKDGITYQVQEGKIDSVEYGPTKRDGHLYCGHQAAKKVPY